MNRTPKTSTIIQLRYGIHIRSINGRCIVYSKLPHVLVSVSGLDSSMSDW